MIKSIFTKPKVCKSKKGWYVFFRYEKRLKRYKLGLNYIKNLKDREREANVLVKVLHHKLENGWNPNDEVKATNTEMHLLYALQFALEKKKPNIAKKSYFGYNSTVNFVTTAIKGSVAFSYFLK